jgi:hypothetical protein
LNTVGELIDRPSPTSIGQQQSQQLTLKTRPEQRQQRWRSNSHPASIALLASDINYK